MKCIKCSADNDFQKPMANIDRCINCQHPFVFVASSMPPTTKLNDFFFVQLLDEISAKKTLFFTPHQLYYLLNKRLHSSKSKVSLAQDLLKYLVFGLLVIIALSFLGAYLLKLPIDLLITILISIYTLGIVITIAQSSVSHRLNRRDRQSKAQLLKVLAGLLLLVGLPISIATQSLLGITTTLGAGLMAILLNLEQQRQQYHIADIFLIDKNQFQEYLSQWIKINGEPVKILSESQKPMPILPPSTNPEVTTYRLETKPYQFDRAVICNRTAIAQLLIRNNFQSENSCAVLTIDGYPTSTFATTMEILYRNPKLKVYALHDASPHGVQMIYRLRREEIWFPNITIPIIDVGIMPRQVINNLNITTGHSKKVAQASRRMPPTVRDSLLPAELKWLDMGCYADLESFSSQQIIQILQRAIDESSQLNEGEDLLNADGSNVDFYLLENFE